jgi:hypothetical protein
VANGATPRGRNTTLSIRETMKPSSPIIPGQQLPETVYAKDQSEYQPLPVWRDEDGTVLSRWHCSWRERLRILISGDVYLWQLTFNRPLQPVNVEASAPKMEGDRQSYGGSIVARIGSLRLYRTGECRIFPRISFSRRSEYFCGGIYGAWLRWSFEYDHLSAAWTRLKNTESTKGTL